ncbi:hypothetical protein SAMN04488529_106139 [Clostridium gasigenes]|uniref:Uncharacterized protein n=1 Tax=Clostridium gasigenes TaxID=94869 RepID=A0A1H0T932_9CLOT|nr:hypothetical protein SAMN04488529_106139 [Clostridium gasigenes]
MDYFKYILIAINFLTLISCVYAIWKINKVLKKFK